MKFFDRQGRLTATVGRQGEGPGEFQALGAVHQCVQDSLFAIEGLSGSISVFSASGQFARKFQLAGLPYLITCSRHGTLAFLYRRMERPRPGVTRLHDTGALSITDVHDANTRELGEVSLMEWAEVGRGWLPPPGSGTASLAVTRRRVVACPMDSSALVAYSLTGARLSSVPLRVPRRAPTRRELERSADETVMRMPTSAMRDRARQLLLNLAPPQYLPPCNGLFSDPDDNVWVVLSFPGDSVTTLRAFGPNDRVLGDVSVPAALNVHEIGSDYLLASGETPEGEPWVRMYRVRRTPAR
jgi:hypothetical protein